MPKRAGSRCACSSTASAAAGCCHRAYHRLRPEGVTAARFMHSLLPWRMPFINLRSHKKILVMDGVVAFTGGMNIADENVMATHPKVPVQDLHFRIDGPVVSQLAEAFADDWAFVTGEDLEGAAWLPQTPRASGPPARVIEFRAGRGSREGGVRRAPGGRPARGRAST